jgi:hypothetical protein
MTARAASNPPSTNTAPNTASSASARIDGRSAPPLRARPRRADLVAKREARATRASVSWLTSAARARDRSPLGNGSKAIVEHGADTQFRTASPTNSRRSLCEAP